MGCITWQRVALRTADFLISAVVVLFLLTAGAYSAYALWDNNQVYAAVDNVQGELLQFKPAADGENGASFEELLAINSDVKAWLTLDNTAIDYPVVQGENNFSYINTDVYGDFALAGSIFLDSDCDGSFHDPYSLLYGHHMENSKMFGDLQREHHRHAGPARPHLPLTNFRLSAGARVRGCHLRREPVGRKPERSARFRTGERAAPAL